MCHVVDDLQRGHFQVTVTTDSNVTSDVIVMPMVSGPFSEEPTPNSRPEVSMHPAVNAKDMVEALKSKLAEGCESAATELQKKTKRSKVASTLGRSLINAGVSGDMLELMKANLHSAMPVNDEVTNESCWAVRTPVKSSKNDGAMFVPNFSGSASLEAAKGIAGIQLHLVYSTSRSSFKITYRCAHSNTMRTCKRGCGCV